MRKRRFESVGGVLSATSDIGVALAILNQASCLAMRAQTFDFETEPSILATASSQARAPSSMQPNTLLDDSQGNLYLSSLGQYYTKYWVRVGG